MNPFKSLFNWYKRFKQRCELEKRIKELRKRDPFIY